MHLRFSATRPRRSSRLLSCHRSVGCPSLNGLTTKHARKFDIPRRGIKSAIIVLARLIWAQTDRGRSSCLSVSRPSKRQSNAIGLHRNRGSECRLAACPPSLALQQTAHSTRRAGDRPGSTVSQWVPHPCRRALRGRQRHSRRDIHRLIFRSSARCPSRLSPEHHWRTTHQVAPMSRDRPLSRNRSDRASTLSCSDRRIEQSRASPKRCSGTAQTSTLSLTLDRSAVLRVQHGFFGDQGAPRVLPGGHRALLAGPERSPPLAVKTTTARRPTAQRSTPASPWGRGSSADSSVQR
jgi:hypothetical protein